SDGLPDGKAWVDDAVEEMPIADAIAPRLRCSTGTGKFSYSRANTRPAIVLNSLILVGGFVESSVMILLCPVSEQTDPFIYFEAAPGASQYSQQYAALHHGRIVLEIDIGQRLAVAVLHDEAGVGFVGGPRCGEASGLIGHHRHRSASGTK